MQFNWSVDGSIVGLYILLSLVVGIIVRKYVKNVNDFLVAGRNVDLHVGIASLAATEFGIITCMAAAQLGYKYGFAGATVGLIMTIVMFTVGKTGFCIEPLRKAGVVTIPEFFEHKFGKKVRWAAGVVIVLGGLLNMGVFLRTGGEFLVAVAGLKPEYLEITMTILLLVVALYTILGGMLSVLVTDYMQFILMSVGLVLTTCTIFYQVGWDTLFDTAISNYGAGGINPFVNPNLGWQYVLYTALVLTATVLTWQTMVSRVLSAKDANVAKKNVHTHQFILYRTFINPCDVGCCRVSFREFRKCGRKTNPSNANNAFYCDSNRDHWFACRSYVGGRYVHKLLLFIRLGKCYLQ